MGKFQRHFFVCVNERPEGGRPSCGARGGGEVLRIFEQALMAHSELANTVSISACGCLGPCFDGPTVVVYPEGIWYAPVGAEAAREIAEQHLVGGQPVERLQYRWPD